MLPDFISRAAILGFIALCATSLTGCDVTDAKIASASLAELKSLQKAAETKPLALLLIDPRPRQDFEQAHIPGARNLPLTFFDGAKGKDPRIEQYEIVIVYGEDPGSRIAKGVVKRMVAMDHSDARFFAGGLKAWKAVNLPVESGPTRPLPEPEVTNRRGNSR